MIPPVAQILGQSAPVTAMVGTSPVRIFRDRAPANTLRPYLTWRVIFGSPDNYISEVPGIDNFRTQLDCWADTDGAVLVLAAAVRDALQTHADMIGVNIDGVDDETGIRRYGFDWSFWTPRNADSSS